MIQFPVVRLHNALGLPLPQHATPGSAGVDLAAAIGAPQVLRPMARTLVPTGLKIALPPGFEGQVRPRSGLSIKFGVTVINAPGTIDSDYRGELQVPLINLGEEDFVIERGLRIAQLVVARYEPISFQQVAELEESQRGEGGFGHTGLKS